MRGQDIIQFNFVRLHTPWKMVRIFFIDTLPLWGDVYFIGAFTVLSAVEQLTEHLRGSLGRTLPGANTLAAELGINHKTVEAA